MKSPANPWNQEEEKKRQKNAYKIKKQMHRQALASQRNVITAR